MPPLTLRGITVDFPFTPYPCQKDYMSKVIECLQNKVNGVLESPTGTGKTLCLLCATLGWREYFKDSISARKIAEKMGGAELFPDRPLSSWGTTATDGDVPGMKRQEVIFVSKFANHTILHVILFFNHRLCFNYRPKVCVLGSREQLCINQDVMKQESNHVKVHMCRAKVSSRSCVFYNNVDEKSTDKDIMNSILDVEDLVKTGKKERVCPYYLSRSLKQHADIIFMPYNYLLDPKSRRAHNIELKGAVVIFDEAHNVEKMCEESTSFDLTPYDLTSAIDAVDKLLREQAAEVGKGDPSEDFNVESLNSGLSFKSVEQEINTFFSLYFLCIFKFALCSFYRTEIGHHNHLTSQPYSEAETLVLSQVHIHPDTSNFKKKQSADVWASSSVKKQGNVLSYWCFSPGYSMQELLRQEVRCIILTSGTLSPLSSFTYEMHIPFPVCLENPHVIQQDQIFVSIVDKGPDGVQLSTAFDKRWVHLSLAVLNLSRVVPHGLLVFFPSYPVLDKTLEYWRVYRIENMKPMFVEPKGKGTFTEVIDGFYDKVNDPKSNGGTFFAVCRGKASEGLDFADTYGRGVIITGLPFPPRMDPRVVLKMQYLDEMCKNKTRNKQVADSYLSGQEWYRQQASRAVNQAIGRVIRHREDYGAIFLCDHRFKYTDARAQLPSWIRPCVRIYDNFGSVVRDAAQFFRVAQKLVSNNFVLSDYPKDGTARLCIQYEMDMSSSKKKPLSLLDALDNSEPRLEEEDHLAGEERASRLSTLSLQYDKRLDDESRGGKRKIRVVQDRVTKPLLGKTFMLELKKSLSQDSFTKMMHALQVYKATDNLDDLVTKAAELLIQDPNTHSLLRGLYQFIRPHHKKQFDEKCQLLTGQGCGYKPEHSLSREERETLVQQTAKVKTSEMGASKELDSSKELNQGGSHLGTHNLCGGVSISFVCVKAKQYSQLTLQTYKKTNNYEQMVSTVVGLLTERDEDIVLLKRLAVFIPPHHSQQFSEMLRSLTGSALVTCQDSEEASNHPNPGRTRITFTPGPRTHTCIC
uniref:Regulator of telomere elongation helicase 1 n=1 Tax=Pygocentrus nattereri TaxID=42514 RepID=A0AAR2M5B6_PYGNA